MSFQDNPPSPRARVLVVDDCKDTAESLGMFLSLHGYAYITANSGGEAFAILEHLTPDVIILDIKMPNEDGWHLARRIVQLLPQKPLLIAVSGLAQPDDKQRSIEAGFDFHFNKPADPALLARLISAYVANRKTFLEDPKKDHPPSSQNGRVYFS